MITQNMEKIKVTYEEFLEMIEILVKQIQRDGMNYSGIYGIPKGGLPAATWLAYRLKLPIVEKPDGRTLIVDDISDTGQTLIPYRQNDIACLYTSKWTNIEPTYWADVKTKKNSWLIFPWEVEEYEIS